MNRLFLISGYILTVVCVTISYASEETDHLTIIKELAKENTPNGNPKLLAYWKSLSKEHTLTVLRQFGKETEAETPIERWPELGIAVAQLMHFYPEPLQLSDEDIAMLSEKKKRYFQAGMLRGRISDGAFDKLITGIKNKKEGAFFRYALAQYCTLKRNLGPELTKAQKNRLIDAYLTVLDDRKTPPVVRVECCRGASKFLTAGYNDVINSDEVVRKLKNVAGPADHWRNVESLIDSGDIMLTLKTGKQLRKWKERLLNFRNILDELQKDKQQSTSLRTLARVIMAGIDCQPRLNVRNTVP